MTQQSGPPAGWYPDPSGQHAKRYWDGATWTEQVSDGGADDAAAPPAPGSFDPYAGAPDPSKVQRQVERAGVAPVAGGGGGLFDEPVLVVNQKAKLIELTNEYAVFDQQGRQLGTVRQVGQSWFRKILRALTSYDQFFKTQLEVRDHGGQAVLGLTRPAKFFKSKVIVERPGQGEVGRIVQQNMVGKIRFAFEVHGQQVGGINAENWRAWNFSITDAAGTEVARVTKTWEGVAKTMFTTADNYVVQIHRPLEEPLRTLVVASALCIDTALKQDARGLG